MDPFVNDLMQGRIYSDIGSVIYNSDGSTLTVKGLHLICDGGYHKVPAMICPMTFRTDMKDVFWSEWVESVRNDVECTFGILKQRFRILKHPFQYHSLDLMEDIFIVCDMIHNALLIVDGANNNWESSLRHKCGDDIEAGTAPGNDVLLIDEEDPNEEVILPVDESEQNGINPAATTLMETEEILETNAYNAGVDGWLHFDHKVKLLVNHFSHCYNSGKLRWMRTSVDGSKGYYHVGQRKVGYNGVIDRIMFFRMLLIAQCYH